ncbi:hypothetical protein K504DRAFT_370562 [Pleomassaria siparia CBS 279.74]|uniref:Uncharacterized protein n=1 Tax=Pleomassaria siparia CBS 279.74 TaxID=1314801 RepID=A0A6G1KJH7_9PLEO|nr:hypothetical protein K504DRAFT_370562 [Pleomassaria siparia CBS 279.74]
MANTLNAAMLDSYRSLSNVTGNCPNDRCTWEPYTSLGICYTTEDITSTITDYKGNLTVSQRQPVIEASVFGDKNTNTSPYWTFGSTALYFTDGAELTQESIPTPNNTDSNFPDIADIYVLYYDPCHDGTTDYRESKNWRAFKATTRLCLQTLQSSFNASMNTTMLSSRSDLTWVLSASADTLDEQYCVEEKGEIFCIDRPTLRVLGGQMSINFNTTGSLIPGGDDYYGARWSPNLVQDILGAPATKCNNATAGLGYEGFSNRIRNIAVAMTNEMRTSNATDFVTGTTTASEQYIAVEYIWISYPIAVYAILTIFFFSTIFATRRDPLWKSSPLALLHAMDGNKTNSSMKQMEEEAKQTRVRFAYPGMGLGWQLVPESPQATQVRLSRRGQVPES